jgi:large subunit ribosomal protein L17
MRHKNAFKKLNRTAAHRRALFRNLASSLLMHNRIETTIAKAKSLRPIADRLVTLGKKDTLHNRRLAMRMLFPINVHAEGNAQKLTVVHKLFGEIAPRYSSRNGGYTRVVRTRKRSGDNAQLAVIEFVEEQAGTAAKKRKRRAVKRTQTAPEAAAGESAQKAEQPASDETA